MLTEIKVEIAPESADSAEELLFAETSGAWSVLEDAPARRAWLVGLFEGREEAERAWSELNRLGVLRPLGAAAFRDLGEREWRESYKAHFRPWQFGRLHWVPVWERAGYGLPAGHAALWLDPGLAFGTGNHETTRLCCERLVALAEAGRAGAVIDAGCGSGILALSAVLLGFEPVSGFDVDPDAVRISRENAALNGLDGKVSFELADLESGLRGRRATAVLANIQADVLAAHAEALANAVLPGGSLVLSGILAGELGMVRARFASPCQGWQSASRTLGEWSDLSLTRP